MCKPFYQEKEKNDPSLTLPLFPAKSVFLNHKILKEIGFLTEDEMRCRRESREKRDELRNDKKGFGS